MKTSSLEAFLLTVDSGSMAEASRRLNITAAAVAQQIKSLESEIGVELVTRVGKTVRPTEAGHRILEHSRTLLHDATNLKALANLGEISGELRLGSINTAAESLVPEVIAQLVGAYPDLKFHIKTAQSSELFDSIQQGDMDAAVCLHPQFSLPKTLVWQQLREEKLIAIVPREMAGREPHELLQTMPFIRFDRKQWGGRLVDRYLQKANIIPRERVEISDLSAIAMLVGRGLGIALVPDTVMPVTATARLMRLPLPIDTEARQLGILWQRSSIHQKLINIFVKQAILTARTDDITDS